MKTSHHGTSNQKKNHAFIRLSMMVAGIVIAIIISLTLIETPHLDKGIAGEHEQWGVNGMMGVFRMAATDYSLDLAGKVAATLWPF